MNKLTAVFSIEREKDLDCNLKYSTGLLSETSSPFVFTFPMDLKNYVFIGRNLILTKLNLHGQLFTKKSSVTCVEKNSASQSFLSSISKDFGTSGGC